MSTAPIDSGGSGGGINRILSHFSTPYRTNSIGVVEKSSNSINYITNSTNNS